MRLGTQAERALLGAVLCDPAGQGHVLDLVRPEDMFRPWHGQVVGAMQRLRSRSVLPSAQQVYKELQGDHDLPRSVALDAVPLAALIESAPRPAHAGRYAVMVVEDAICRDLELVGSRLVQATDAGHLDSAIRQVVATRADVQTHATRWEALPQHFRAQLVRPASSLPQDTGLRRADSPSDRRGQSPAASAAKDVPDDAAVVMSARTLRDLIDDPGQLAAVRGWLRPAHFAPHAHAVLFGLLQEMDAAQVPIDPVTVSWEAARRGMVTDPRRLAGGIGPFAVADAGEVRRLAILGQIATAGEAIQADAASLACAPDRLLQLAAARLQSIEVQPGPDMTAASLTGGRLAAAPCTAVREPDREAAT